MDGKGSGVVLFSQICDLKNQCSSNRCFFGKIWGEKNSHGTSTTMFGLSWFNRVISGFFLKWMSSMLFAHEFRGFQISLFFGFWHWKKNKTMGKSKDGECCHLLQWRCLTQFGPFGIWNVAGTDHWRSSVGHRPLPQCCCRSEAPRWGEVPPRLDDLMNGIWWLNNAWEKGPIANLVEAISWHPDSWMFFFLDC